MDPRWSGAAWNLYEQMDQARRWQGDLLDALGWGPRQTPSRVVMHEPGVTLKAYAAAGPGAPPLLLVPAPIKRAYILDLAPGASVVECCLAGGVRPYVIQWESPQPELSLVDYSDSMILKCVDAIGAETGRRSIAIAGHSLGGLCAAVFSALHPQRVRALVLLAAPLHFSFDAHDGALGPVMAAVARAGAAESLPGNLPGSFLSLAGVLASPRAFAEERLADWVQSLPDAHARDTHMRVERWALDELPLARQFVIDLVELLYRRDSFVSGTLQLGTLLASPARMRAPLLSVVDTQCPVVPPRAMLPFHQAAGSPSKRLLRYHGDLGVGIRHVGVLVGRSAVHTLWPRILQWAVARREASA